MEIKISKSARQCAACNKEFVHEQKLISAMRRGPEGWLREDYCPACLTEDRGASALCVWSAHYIDAQALAQQPAEALSPLRQAFYEAAEKPDRASVAVAYLAGQLLRRQKAFRFIKQTVDPETEAAVMLFLDRIGNKMIEVHDPNLITAELERGRVALLHRLAEIEGTLDESETNPTAIAEVSPDAPAPAAIEEESVDAASVEEEDEYEEDEYDEDDDDEYEDDEDEDDDGEVVDEDPSGDGEVEDEYAQT